MNSMCTCVRKVEETLAELGLEGQTVQGTAERYRGKVG